jgi:AcrR family transcriptional regulator
VPDPRPRGRPARHTTADIVGAACALADREGLDVVTTRRVAAELGMAAASLYTYVGTRDELLALMLDAVHAEYRLAEPTGDPIADVVAVAGETHRVLLRHPWAVALLEAGPNTGAAALDVLEHVVAVLSGHPADDASKLAAYGAVNAVVVAFVRSETTDHASARRTVDGLSDADPERHPHVAALRIEPQESSVDPLRHIVTRMLEGLLGPST